MSKAFTRESDEAQDELPLRSRTALPPGVKNYMTPDGERRLREEATMLLESERPRFLAMSQNDETRAKLHALDQRVREIEEGLLTAEIILPPEEPATEVRFGATVTVRAKRAGSESRYRIVGFDEADFDKGWVSWQSPIAKALLNKRVGQRVPFRFPSGEEELEIVSVLY